jgi:hypothetical protein
MGKIVKGAAAVIEASGTSTRALLVPIAIASAFLCSGARASCLEAWPPDMKVGPEFTCVPITERLLVSLEHATKAQVIRAMKADGRPIEIDLHFASNAEGYSGDVNFEFENETVVLIFAMVDTESGPPLEFTWNSNYTGDLPNPCSDLPESRYARCNK